jgi:hypothetical protein
LEIRAIESETGGNKAMHLTTDAVRCELLV